MKTKKLLSLLLAIIMAASMMATLGITASAGQMATWVKVEKNGQTFWYLLGKVEYTEYKGDEEWICECWEESGLAHGKFAYSMEYDSWWADNTCDHIVTYEPLTSLVMKDMPAKTEYTVGDKIDLTGAKMTAATVSNTVKDVNITSSMVSGFDSTTAGKKTVTVTYRNLTTSFDVTVTPKNECTLDLDSTTTDIKEKKELDQNYNLTVTEMPSASGAVTKVKLSWEITDIDAVRIDNKVWDTTELKWVVASSNTTIMEAGKAKFTLENYSNVKVNATASFKAENGFNGTASYDAANGKVTLDTANGNSAYSKANVPTKVINATITTAADDFKTLTATTKATKYGTYTVTLSEYKETYAVTYNLNYVTTTAPAEVEKGSNFTATFVIEEGLSFGEPSVQVGKTELVYDTDYTFDAETGVMNIPAAKITGNLTIGVYPCGEN